MQEYILVSPLRRTKLCYGPAADRSSCLWHAVVAVFGPRDEFRAARWRSKVAMSSKRNMTKQIMIISVFLTSALLMPASVWACHYGCYEYEPVGLSAMHAHSGQAGYASPVDYAVAGGW